MELTSAIKRLLGNFTNILHMLSIQSKVKFSKDSFTAAL